MGFIPLAVTTFGAWDYEAAANIRDIAKLQARTSGRDPSISIKHLFERLSVCLQRGNGNWMFSRNPLLSAPSHVDGFY
jgi:hypothetical protein